MGSGDFGSNGSVHWRVKYSDVVGNPPDHLDYDNTKKHPGQPFNSTDARPMIGSNGHPGKFRIRARYPNHGLAQAALNAAQAGFGATDTVIELDVDLRPFAQVSNGPGNPDDWEINVEW
jgi:hypothetical protein